MSGNRPFEVLAFLALCVLLGSCAEPLDLTRPQMERGTLGEELYRIFLRDLERTPDQAEAKATAFRAHEIDFIWAVDTIVPADRTDEMKGLLLDLLTLWDDDTLPDLVRKIAFVLDDVLASEPLLTAWSRTQRFRQDYVHQEAAVALLDRIANYGRLRDLAVFASDLALSHDGLGPDGFPLDGESDALARLERSIRDRLSDAPDPTDVTRTMALVAELLLRSDERFGLVAGLRPAWTVRLDPRGLAAVSRDTEGSLNYLFVDEDLDGLADIDMEGRFVGQDRLPFWVAPYGAPYQAEPLGQGGAVFRDELGRAHDPRDDLIYQYVDLNQTPLGYVVRRMPELVRQGILGDLSIGLDGLLGDLITSGEYPRFPDTTPLLDLTHALFWALDFEWLPELAEGASKLLSEHEDTLATLLLVAQNAADIVEELGCEMEPDNAMLDDLLVPLNELMQPEDLLDDLLVAVQDPVFIGLFEAMDDLISHYNDRIEYRQDGPYFLAAEECLALYAAGSLERFHCLRSAPHEEIFDGPTDHSAVSGAASISLSQKLVHLIYVASGTPFEMVIESIAFSEDGEPFAEDIGPIIHVPDTAAAFFDSVVGNFCLIDYVNLDLFRQDEAVSALMTLAELLGITENEEDFAQLVVDIVVDLSGQIGVHLDECPTANQTLRYYNLPDYVITAGPVWVRLAPPIDGEGFIFSQNVVDSLIAAEAVGALEALYPVLKPLSDRGLTPLVGRIVGDMYRYYPESSQSYRIADGSWADLEYSGIRRYEPALLRIFRDGRLGTTLARTALALRSVTLSVDRDLPGVIQEFAAHLLAPEEGLVNRRGETTARRGDGEPTPLTRCYLIKEALDALDQSLQADPEAQEAWERAADTLVDLLLEVVEDDQGEGHFEDRGSPALAALLAEHAWRQTGRLRDQGELHHKLSVDYPQYFEDTLTSRGFAALVELLREVRSDPEDLDLVNDLLLYLSEQVEPLPRAGLDLIYSLLFFTTDQAGYVEAARLLAGILDPQREYAVASTPRLPLVTHVATFIRGVLEADDQDEGLAVLRRAVSTSTDGDSPLTALVRVVRDIHRLSPGSGEPVSAGDLESVIGAVVHFIRDDVRGLERIFDLVQERTGPRQRLEP